jgi:hypothetical protein
LFIEELVFNLFGELKLDLEKAGHFSGTYFQPASRGLMEFSSSILLAVAMRRTRTTTAPLMFS